MSRVAEIILQHGRDVANAAAARGQARAATGQAIGNIPAQAVNAYQQMTQFSEQRDREKVAMQTAKANATVADVNARTATQGETEQKAFSDILAKTPKVVRDGTTLDDEEAIYEALKAQGINPAKYVPSVQAMNKGFLEAHATRAKMGQTALDEVNRLNNDPSMGIAAIKGMVANKFMGAEDGERLLQFVQVDPKTGAPRDYAGQQQAMAAVTNAYGSKQEVGVMPAGSQPYDKATGKLIGEPVPANVTQATLAAAAAKGDPVALKAIALLKGNESNPTAASLALKAAQGDPEAVKALALLKQQNQGPQASYSWAKDPKTGEVVRATDDEIRSRGLVQPDTAFARNLDTGKGRVRPLLESVVELSEKINTNQGVYAKLAGGVEKQKAKLNLDDDMAEYESMVTAFAPLWARALGHVGVLTQVDVDSARTALPRPGDSKSLAARKIARIEKILGEDYTPATPPPAGGGNTTQRVQQGGKTYDVVMGADGKVVSSTEVK